MSNSVKKRPKFDAVVCLSAIDWDFLWQRTQEVMSQFALLNYPVLFIENTGVRVPGLKDVPRVLKRFKKLVVSDKSRITGRKFNNIEVLSPQVLPFPYSPSAVKLNNAILRGKILRFSTQNGIPIDRILFWTYMTTPLGLELATGLNWADVVVDLVSDPSKVQGAGGIACSHKKMLEIANLVLCASEAMVRTAKQQVNYEHHPKITLFEDGFSTGLLDDIHHDIDQLQTPVDYSRHVVTYIGGINDKIWWDAVSSMAQNLPEINFVFAGPKQNGELPVTGRNISWIPPFQNYEQLGIFLKRCSVGLIPYVPTDYVAEMRPAKINEYMVAGLPIVSTELPEMVRFAEENGKGIIYLAGSPKGFVGAVEQAIKDNCQEFKTKRKNIVLNRSWEKICYELVNRLQLT